MKRVVLLLAFVLLLVGTYVPLTRIRDSLPPEARLEFFPPAPVVKALSADQYQFLSQVISLQCLFYFGTLVEERKQVPEWSRIHDAIYTATRLDPYNMDAYYFAQAVLTWDGGMTRQAVELLEYGFEHRTWDWYLPFFISFNYAFFLKDYNKAGEYAARAAELNPQISWFSTLAARYFYEGGSTALALAYLQEMIPTARSEAIRQRMITRAVALERILQLEEAVSLYTKLFHRTPSSLDQLVQAEIIEQIPSDPYGGNFYLDDKARVRTTSKLAFGKTTHGTNKD